MTFSLLVAFVRVFTLSLLAISPTHGFQPTMLGARNNRAQHVFPSPTSVSLTKQQLEDFVTATESQAITASESWVVDATDFLTREQSTAVQNRLEGRADVVSWKVGHYHNGEEPSRVRYVFANPDLGYDDASAEGDYCAVLKIDNVNLSNCDPWANIVASIGVPLEHVGDIVVLESESTVYLAVFPDEAKTCMRLLPKELPGAGVTVTLLTADHLAMMDINGQVQDMDIQRLDKRAQKK